MVPTCGYLSPRETWIQCLCENSGELFVDSAETFIGDFWCSLYFFPINKLILIHWEEGKKWWPTFYLGWVLVDQRVARTSHKPWVIGKCWIFCCWCWHFKYPICVHNLNVEEKQQTTLWLQQCTLVVHKLCTSCHNFISIVFFWGGEIHSANFHSQFKVILD